jgi:DEAD/DEAH box helicase domain-containing protein
VLCDPKDIRSYPVLRAPYTHRPTIFLYETYPGGVGISDKLYTHYDRLLSAATNLIENCGCKEGCPSCVGPAGETGAYGKAGALVLAGLKSD